jgi:hypothetical protein
VFAEPCAEVTSALDEPNKAVLPAEVWSNKPLPEAAILGAPNIVGVPVGTSFLDFSDKKSKRELLLVPVFGA